MASGSWRFSVGGLSGKLDCCPQSEGHPGAEGHEAISLEIGHQNCAVGGAEVLRHLTAPRETCVCLSASTPGSQIRSCPDVMSVRRCRRIVAVCVCVFVAAEVPSLGTGTHRQIPHVFGMSTTASEKKAMMPNIFTPMTESVTFRKMWKRQDRPPLLSLPCLFLAPCYLVAICGLWSVVADLARRKRLKRQRPKNV